MRFVVLAALLIGCGPKAGPAGPAGPAGAPPGGFGPAPNVGRSGDGLTKEGAIEVCDVMGEREYLARLRCGDGSVPQYERRGNVGSRQNLAPGQPEPSFEEAMDMHRQPKPGENDLHIVDVYEVVCAGATREVFLDMCHCAQPAPSLAPPGFTIAP